MNTKDDENNVALFLFKYSESRDHTSNLCALRMRILLVFFYVNCICGMNFTKYLTLFEP